MQNLHKLAFDYLIKNDIDYSYQKAINKLAIDHSILLDFNKHIASNSGVDPAVLKATEIVIEAFNDVDKIFKIVAAEPKKEDEEEPKLSFFTRAVIKTLKTAQALLVGLFPQSPFKIGIAYNALHFVIRYVENEMKKKAREKLKKKQEV